MLAYQNENPPAENNDPSLILTSNKKFSLSSSRLLNSLTHFCGNGKIYYRGTYGICGNMIYNRTTQFCFNHWKIYNKSGKYRLCCHQLYNRVTHFCYKCRQYRKGKYMVCGDSVYQPKKQFCFKKCAFDRAIYSVCGSYVYDKSRYQCKNGQIVAKSRRVSHLHHHHHVHIFHFLVFHVFSRGHSPGHSHGHSHGHYHKHIHNNHVFDYWNRHSVAKSSYHCRRLVKP